MTAIPVGHAAPLARRVLAYLIDALINGTILALLPAVGIAVWSVTQDVWVLLAATAAGGAIGLGWGLAYTAMQGRAGSIGMRSQGLRLLGVSDGRPLGFGRALVRNLVWAGTTAVVVGYFSALFDPSGRFQGWHDRASGGLMTDVRASGTSEGADSSPGASAPRAVLVTPRDVGAESAHQAPAPGLAATDPLITVVPGVTPGMPLRSTGAAPASASPPPDRSRAPATTGAILPTLEPPAAGTLPADDDVESTKISVPGHRLVFTWDDGQRITVSARTIFGRNPEPEPGVAVVIVRDETRSLSKTHFEAGAEPTGGWVLDRSSTNGTTIVRNGDRIACPPGQRMPVRLGDALEIGDRIVTIGGYS
ncbi:MAG: RDD family protein [Propioniciclava sp.]